MKDVKLNELSPAWRELYDAAVAARKNAYIPYSNFAVGATVRCANGKIYGGCNVENASYGLCVCGERNAIFHAACAGEREMVELCVIADTSGPVSPCGACRQVISGVEDRFNHPVRILLYGTEGVYECSGIDALLPLRFVDADMRL